MVGPLRQENPKPKKRELPPILQSAPEGPSQEPNIVEGRKQPKSVSGWVENVLNDGWDTVKGLYEIIPSAWKSYDQNLPYILKNLDALTPGMVGEAAKDTAKGLGKAIIEPYQKHGVDVFYYRPVTVAADFVTLLSLGGGSIKNAGKLAKASGGGARAEKLIQAGKWLEELPSKVGRKALDSTVSTLTGGSVDLAKRRKFLAIKGEEQGRRVLKIEEDVNSVVKKIDGLTPAEKEIFHKARVMGDVPGYGIADELLPPKVKEALDAYADLVNRVDPALNNHGVTEFYKSRGLLNAETAENSIAKKFALEAFDDVSDAAIARAKDLIAKAKRKPVYGKNSFPGKGAAAAGESLVDDMISGGKYIREGKVGSLEALKGAKGYTKDPSVYVREMIRDFRETEAKVRLSERLLEEKALIKGGGGGEGLSKEAIPEGVHRSYYEDRVRAEALKSITDPTIKRLLRWEYIKNNSGLIRLYDRLHGIFAKSATMFNPKWVTGNVVGDAVLGLLAGSDWVEGVRHLKRGAMPAQILGRNVTLSTEDLLKNPGALKKAATYLPEKAADIAGYVDQATRAGIISREVGRRLKEVAASFEGSSALLEEVLRSTDRFSDVQVGMRILAEKVERRSAEVLKRTKQIARLEELERRQLQKLEAMDFRRRVATGGTLERKEAKAAAARERIPGPEGAHDWMTETKRKPTGKKLEDLKGKASEAEKAALWARQKTALGAAGTEGFEKGVSRLEELRQKIVNLTAENRAVIRDITDDLAKRGDLEKLVPGLREQVNIVRPAVERANAFVGDYLALDGFEQGVLRRLIPFYPWAKAMSMLAFRMPFLSPVKTFAWNRFSDALATMTQDPDLPDEYRGRVPVAVTKDGKTVWVKLTSYSPFESLKTSRVADIPVPGMFNVGERNPWLALGYRFLGGKTIYDATSVPYGEQMVSIGDGTVLRVRPDGKVDREIPQAPLVSGIMHTFPSVQLVESVLSPYWTNKYNWAGLPEPVLNADGSYKYPRELWDRLSAAVGVNVQTRSKSDIVRSRRAKAIRNVREMQSQYRRTTDPEEREMILNAMRDTIEQEVHGKRP